MDLPSDLLRRLTEEEEDPEGLFENARSLVAELRASLATLAREALDAESRLRRRERLPVDERTRILRLAGLLWTPEEVEGLRKVLDALP